jgi:DNA repair exonuclease SbcCD ATPase subunit
MVVFNYFRAEYMPKTSRKDFLKIVVKEVPKEPQGSLYNLLGKIKLAAEIPQFKDVSISKKDQWDSIAKELTKIEAKLNNSIKKTIQSSEALLAKKIAEKLDNNRETFKKEINQDSSIQKINHKINVIEKEHYPLRVEYSSLYKTKIAPLETKKHHIAMGAPGSIRSYLFWSCLPIFLVEPLEALYKKTHAYKDLDKQVSELREQQKKINSKMKPYEEEIGLLLKRKQARTAVIVEKSKKLQALTSEIESLEKEHSEAWKKYFELQKKDADKDNDLIEKFRTLRNFLHKLFDEIVAKHKIIPQKPAFAGSTHAS